MIAWRIVRVLAAALGGGFVLATPAQAGGGISGRVVDAAGNPLPGLHVYACPFPIGLCAHAVSSQDGTYRLNTPNGRYRLQFGRTSDGNRPDGFYGPSGFTSDGTKASLLVVRDRDVQNIVVQAPWTTGSRSPGTGGQPGGSDPTLSTIGRDSVVSGSTGEPVSLSSLLGIWHGYTFHKCTGSGFGIFTWIVSGDGKFRSIGVKPVSGQVALVGRAGTWTAGSETGTLTVVDANRIDGVHPQGEAPCPPLMFRLHRVPSKAAEIAVASQVEWIVRIAPAAGEPMDCDGSRVPRSISLDGFLGPSVDPTNEKVMRGIYNSGKEYVKEYCPVARPPGLQLVWNGNFYSAGYQNGSSPAVTFSDYVMFGAPDGYRNLAAETVEAREASERKQRAEAQAKLAQENAQRARNEKFEAFKKRSRVDVWLSAAEAGNFTSNPFPWKGKTVGLIAEFVAMRSENSAIFAIGGTNFVVISNLPATRFTTSGQRAMIAGRVQGVTQASLPIIGTVPVPEIALSTAEDPP
jgi:hypothetical protein